MHLQNFMQISHTHHLEGLFGSLRLRLRMKIKLGWWLRRWND